MDKILDQRNNKQVAFWLLTGVAMILVQVLIGGITRLTESGLSITEWKPITGALPPLNNVAWQAEFDRYKVTDQFKYVHQNFSLSDFKGIFFWEWFHRLWARCMGLVFLTGFIYFLVTKKFNKKMILPMVILFLLGATQGAIGWFMVKSGLVPEKYFVGHIELATHFIAAMGLLCYTLWFALGLLEAPKRKAVNVALQRLMLVIVTILFFQLVYGAFMAGLKAASSAPTWPDINGKIIPSSLTELSPFSKNLLDNKITIHFIHRGLAYLLFGLITYWYFAAAVIKNHPLFSWLRSSLMVLVSLQVLLGILTVLNATYPNRLVFLGVSHQFTGMLLLMCVVAILFVLKRKYTSLAK
jgi:cytochrome c oxidase assembly protein subunit 15